MKAFFGGLGIIGVSVLLVYFLAAPNGGASKPVRISDLTAVSEQGLSTEEMSKLLLAQGTSTYPNAVISGNSPNLYTSGSSPNIVTQGSSPSMMTRGTYPNSYISGGLTNSPNGAAFPMPKLNF